MSVFKKCQTSGRLSALKKAAFFASFMTFCFYSTAIYSAHADSGLGSDWDAGTEAGLAQDIEQVGDSMGIIPALLTPPALPCALSSLDALNVFAGPVAPHRIVRTRPRTVKPAPLGTKVPARFIPAAKPSARKLYASAYAASRASAPSPSSITQNNDQGLANIDSTYANNPQIRDMIGYAWDHHHRFTQMKCYSAVKQALYSAHIVPRNSLPGASASDAVPDLERRGFVNLLDVPGYQNLRTFPERAPVGSIVVYSGSSEFGWSKYGDVQIHMANGEWISDYYSRNAMLRQTTVKDGRSYPDRDYFSVIGVMVDPALERGVSPPALSASPLSPSAGIPALSPSYGISAPIRNMISFAENNKQSEFNPGEPDGYAAVKQALYASGLAPSGSLNSLQASSAVTDLKKQGFVNLIDADDSVDLINHPERAPVGSIVVYSGDSGHIYSKNGDIQIHTANGWVSNYFSKNAVIHQTRYNGVYDGNLFHVIGVMINPNVSAQSLASR